jgi:hypothetical protein
VLAAETGWEGAVIVLSPVDFRRRALPVDYRPRAPWVVDLYVRLRATLEEFPVAPLASTVSPRLRGES